MKREKATCGCSAVLAEGYYRLGVGRWEDFGLFAHAIRRCPDPYLSGVEQGASVIIRSLDLGKLRHDADAGLIPAGIVI